MAGRIVREDIDRLKRHADLADIASDYTNLKRAGKRYKGLCPFHQERTPSFTVDPAEGVYYCFGCQAGGDVYTFLKDLEGLTFVEAVEQLARRVGYRLRYEELSAAEKRALGTRSRLVAANAAACDFYHHRLLSDEGGEQARGYLASRGFGGEEARQFRLGYAPDSWDAASRYLADRRFTEPELIDAGLAVRTRRGGLRDRFRGRLMFPVLDLSGDVIGFGGRLLPGLDYGGRDLPKYLNTAETDVYKKHRVLYGMSWARAAVVRSAQALVAEGYTDVLALHQAGLANAVATCGTAVTGEHLRLLARYADQVVLAFDSDQAGGRAAERVWGLAGDEPAGDLDLRVLILPAGRDPADVIAGGGAQAMHRLVADAEPVAQFMLRRVTDGHEPSPEGRAAAVRAAAPVLAEIADRAAREGYMRWVADRVGSSLRAVAEQVEAAGGDAGRKDQVAVFTGAGQPPPSGRRHRLSARAKTERDVLRFALQRPDLLPDWFDEITDKDFTDPPSRGVMQALLRAGGPGVGLEKVTDAAADDDIRTLARAVAMEDPTTEADPAHVSMLLGSLMLPRLQKEIDRRKTRLEQINPAVEPDRHRQQFEELIALQARRRDIEGRAHPV